MLKLYKLQQIFLSLLGLLTLLFIGFAVLGISLFQANREQAASIKQVSTDIINAYTVLGRSGN